jgi:hypothetical protein
LSLLTQTREGWGSVPQMICLPCLPRLPRLPRHAVGPAVGAALNLGPLAPVSLGVALLQGAAERVPIYEKIDHCHSNMNKPAS